MARSESKTIPTGGDVHAFIAAVPDEQRRRDAQLLAELFAQVTGEPPVLWGTAIVGFGSRHYRYDSGREGDVPAVSFSPRKAQTVLYLTEALAEYERLPRAPTTRPVGQPDSPSCPWRSVTGHRSLGGH